MKGPTLFLVLALGSGLNAAAQGTVNFANNTATCVYCDFINGQKVPAGSAFMAELVYAPDGTPTAAFDSVAVRIGAPATFFLAGIFSAGGRTVANITPAGGFGLFQVRVWEAAYGTDYRSTVASGNPQAHAGRSGILRVDTGDPTTVPPGTPASLISAGLASFTIGNLGPTPACVPEPSVVILGLLTAIGAILFRRRPRNRTTTLLLALGFIALGTVSGRAQGSVAFLNNSTSRVYTDAVGGGTTFVPAGNQFTVELMFAPDGTPTAAFDSVAIRVGAATTFAPAAGFFNGGGRTAQGVTPAGGFGLFQVRGWETAFGTDYRSASLVPGAKIGKSAILRVDTADPTTIPPGTPAPLTLYGLNSFCIGCIPEPSTFVLTLCGLTALVFGMRARKK